MKNRSQMFTAAGAILALALLGACAGEPEEEVVLEPSPAPMAVQMQTAMADLEFAEGQTGSGTVTFTSQDGSVRIEAEVSGLSSGPHGFHLHEFGECTQPDFQSAGGHYNPTGATHAGPDAQMHHAGDFGNIMIGEDGTGTLTLTSQMLTIDEIVGKAVVLHQGEDDLQTDPAGNSGPRIACGVVQRTDGGMMGMPGAEAMGMSEDREEVMTTPTGGTRVSPTPAS